MTKPKASGAQVDAIAGFQFDKYLHAAAKFTWLDAVTLVLALFSVTITLVDVFFRPKLYDLGLFTTVIVIDALITLVFLVDFVANLRKATTLAEAVKDNWFDALTLLPMVFFVAVQAKFGGIGVMDAILARERLHGAGGVFGLLRLFRFVRVFEVVRGIQGFLAASGLTLGEWLTKGAFDRYRRIIVAELTTPILTAGIGVTQQIIVRMKFLDSVGRALDEKRPEIHAAVVEALGRNTVTRTALSGAIAEKVVAEMERTVVDTVVETLTAPDLNKLVQEMVVEVLENFKEQLNSPEGKAALLAGVEEEEKLAKFGVRAGMLKEFAEGGTISITAGPAPTTDSTATKTTG